MNASDVLNRLTSHRRRQAGLVDYLLQEDNPLGQKVRFCGSWLHLREWIESGESRLLNANFCKKFLLCRSCAARRAGRLVEAYAPKVESVIAGRPGLVPAMVTLTVKNGADLVERIQHLKASWSKLVDFRRKALSGSRRHAQIEWCKVQGGLRSLEVTRSKNGEWHPHLHVFALLSEYISQPDLVAEWSSITGDSFVVGVTKCHNGIVPGLIETVKYASKLTELKPDECLHVHRSLQGTRGTEPFGILRGVPEPDIDEDDATGLTGAFRDFIATWLFGESRYRLDRIEEAVMVGGRLHPPRLPKEVQP